MYIEKSHDFGIECNLSICLHILLERETIIKEDSREVVEVIAKEIDDKKAKETAAEK